MKLSEVPYWFKWCGVGHIVQANFSCWATTLCNKMIAAIPKEFVKRPPKRKCRKCVANLKDAELVK